MKTSLILAAFWLTCSIHSFANDASTWAEAQAKSKETGKPILIDFSADWCAPCKLFEREKKTEADLKTALENIVLLTLWKKTEEPELWERYNIEAYPTFILTDVNGEVRYRWPGYTKTYFLDKLEDGLALEIGIEARRARFDQEPTFDDALWLAKYHRDLREFGQAKSYYKQADKLRPEDHPSLHVELAHLALDDKLKPGGEDQPLEELVPMVKAAIDHPETSLVDAMSLKTSLIRMWEVWDMNDEIIEMLKNDTLAEEPVPPEGERLRGMLRWRKAHYLDGDSERAVQEMEAMNEPGWKDDPLEVYYLCGNLLNYNFGGERAVELIAEVLPKTDDPELKAKLYAFQSQAHMMLKQWGQAESALAKGEETNPELKDTYFKFLRNKLAEARSE